LQKHGDEQNRAHCVEEASGDIQILFITRNFYNLCFLIRRKQKVLLNRKFDSRQVKGIPSPTA